MNNKKLDIEFKTGSSYPHPSSSEKNTICTSDMVSYMRYKNQWYIILFGHLFVYELIELCQNDEDVDEVINILLKDKIQLI